MPSQVDKNMNKAMDSVAKKEKKRREQEKKRKQAALQFGDIEMDFEIQNTFTEPMKKAKNRKEGKKIVDKIAKRVSSLDELNVKQNKSPYSIRPEEGAAKRLTRKYNERFKKARGGRLGIDNSGQKLVQKLYSKGGKI